MPTGFDQYQSANGMFAIQAAPPVKRRISPYVFFTCLLAGTGGLMYGYDLVVAGGVSAMPGFLAKFYPSVQRSEQSAKQDSYCKYNNQVFQLYTSSLYMAAFVASFFAGILTRKLGHRATMLSAGLLFIAGTVLGASAVNLAMLMLGRVLLGIGLAFSNHAIPLYLSEIAPPAFRGALNILFSINIALGIFGGNLVNYLASHVHPWGWRISLAMAGVPSVLLAIAGVILVDTPSNLIRKGEMERARASLKRLRGAGQDVEEELRELVKAHNQADPQQSFRNLAKRRYRPQVVMAVALPFFQQVSGNDAILFYGPFLFKAAGLSNNTALYSTVVIGCVTLLGTTVSLLVVDRTGRRTILLVSTVVLLFAMTTIGVLFAVKIPAGSTGKSLTKAEGAVELTVLCLFVMFFSGSWGPLSWTIASEIFPQDIRPAAQSLTVFVNMLFKWAIAQTFLSMLCAFKFGIFFFFAGWLSIMGTFVLLLLPETKQVPIDQVSEKWESHWLWSKFSMSADGV